MNSLAGSGRKPTARRTGANRLQGRNRLSLTSVAFTKFEYATPKIDDPKMLQRASRMGLRIVAQEVARLRLLNISASRTGQRFAPFKGQ